MTLVVEDLTKEYGATTALDEVSFEVPDGAFAVVLGESGAGKSTLLRILNGLTTPTAGSVYLDGEEITDSRSDVAMVFQQHNLVEEMTAFGNALTGSLNRTGFVRSLGQWQSRADKDLALEALDTVGLLDEADQQATSMSGGQQQRVGIARALVQDPELLLADEPVASLDPASAETVMRYLLSAAEERDLTTLASLHQVNIARQFGEQFIALKDGQLVFSGSREELTPAVLEDIYGEIETDELREGTDQDSRSRRDRTEPPGAGV
jgi:phosphonate transport system ATP-binding protein